MARPRRISPRQAIYHAFPDGTRFHDGQLTRITDIVSSKGDRTDRLSFLMREALARRIDVELARLHRHDSDRFQRGTERHEGDDTESSGDVISEQEPGLVLPSGFASSGIAPSDAKPEGVVGPVPPSSVGAGDIALIEVDGDATIRSRVFPLTVHCQTCGHLEHLDPESPPTGLQCDCCGQGQLRVESIVFVCGRCSHVRPLIPPGERQPNGYRRQLNASDFSGNAPCPECHDGHVHLDKHHQNNVARWEWRCSRCSAFQETLQEICLRCVLPRTPQRSGSFVFMSALPASAPRALQPLTHREMFVHEEPVTTEALRSESERNATEGWTDAFVADIGSPSPNLSQEENDFLADAGLRAAYVVRDVWSIEATYGYRAGSPVNHAQTPVPEDERLATLFGDPEGLVRFRAFSHTTRGAALVLEFDQNLLSSRLVSLCQDLASRQLTEVIAEEAEGIARTPVRNLIGAASLDFPVYRSLHALEHALQAAAVHIVGTEDLGSRLFLFETTVVILEQASIGRGGVVQLINRGPGLVRLIEEARDQMLGCFQGCSDGCPACTYVPDLNCRPPLDEIGASWLPPNALLSRTGASLILGGHDLGPTY